MSKTNKRSRKLSVELYKFQDLAIGYYSAFGDRELVVDECEHTFTTLVVTKSFGLHISTYGKESEEFKRFPDGKSLTDMMVDCIEFDEWIKENKIR